MSANLNNHAVHLHRCSPSSAAHDQFCKERQTDQDRLNLGSAAT